MNDIPETSGPEPVVKPARVLAHWHDFLAALLQHESHVMSEEIQDVLGTIHTTLGWATNCPGCAPDVEAFLFNVKKTATERGILFSHANDKLRTTEGVELKTYQITEDQRQATVLALAVLSVQRPGWVNYLAGIARVFDGSLPLKDHPDLAEFDAFRKFNSELPRDPGESKQSPTNENESNETQPGTGSSGR